MRSQLKIVYFLEKVTNYSIITTPIFQQTNPGSEYKSHYCLPLIFSFEDTLSSLLNPEAFVELQRAISYLLSDDRL